MDRYELRIGEPTELKQKLKVAGTIIQQYLRDGKELHVRGRTGARPTCCQGGMKVVSCAYAGICGDGAYCRFGGPSLAEDVASGMTAATMK